MRLSDRAEWSREMQLSIIIPVYKVEDYIEKCLQSIVDGSRKSVGKF